MYEYRNGGFVVGQSGNTQKVSKVTVTEVYEDGKLVSKTTTTEYEYVTYPQYTFNVSTDRIGSEGNSTGNHLHFEK
jgi:hypothetical protein